MANDSKAILVAEQNLIVGKKVFIEGRSPVTQYSVVFEDNGETGYLYGLDTAQADQPILDALHIYNVKNVADRSQTSQLRLIWSFDGLKAILLINDYPHAAFDFENRRGYCRTNFPPPDTRFTKFSHEWSDEVMKWFE